MIIDINTIKYKAIAFLANGKKLDLSNIYTELTISEPDEELAQRTTIRLANMLTEDGYLSDILKLCTQIYVYCTINSKDEELFRGITWEWEYSSSKRREIIITAYNKMIYLQKSKGNAYYSSGKSTESIAKDICSKWNINLNYSYKSITNAKVVYKNKTIAEQLMGLLDETESKVDEKYVCIMAQDVLYTKAKGSNKDVFELHAEKNLISTSDKLTLDNLITKVIIVGKQEDSGRIPIEATIDGKLEYGVLQDIVTRSSDNTLAKAKEEAEQLLKEKGKPQETIKVEAPDVPIIRNGDKIKIVGGNLNSFFFINAITHNCHEKTMDLELERIS